MKVIHVIDSLGGSGGAEHGLVREVTRLDPSWDQTVVRLFAKDHLDYVLREHSIEVIGLGLEAGRAGRVWPKAVRLLRALLADRTPDVVQSSLFTSNLVAQMAARNRVPVLSTFTLSGDPALLRRHQPGASSTRARVLRSLAGYAARGERVRFRSLTNDAAVTNANLLGVDPGRVRVVPRGIELPILPAEAKSRSELGLPERVPIVLNVGRQTSQKGHAHLIRAFHSVRRENPAHLVIVGREGEMTEPTRRLITELELEPHVSLPGYTPDVHHYMAHASVFAFPSLMEGLGTAVIEALGAGLPVVAFDIPPVSEVTGGGSVATLVEVGDELALEREISRVLVEGHDPAPGMAWVSDRFAIDVVAAEVGGLLKWAAET